MKDKYYKFTSLILIGIILNFFGIILFIGREKLYQTIIYVLIFLFLVNSFKNLFFRGSSNKTNLRILLDLVFACILTIIPNIGIMILPLLFGIYLLIIGISLGVMFILDIINYTLSIYYIISSLVYLLLGFFFVINPLHNVSSFILFVSIYSFILGITNIFEGVVSLFTVRIRKKFRRKLRVTLPKIVESIIPYSVMLGLSSDDRGRMFGNISSRAKLEIIVHTSPNGVNKMGHIDICLDGWIYSYGNYDEGSRKYRECIGDGVLFITDKFGEYINFCIDNSKKTLFVYGIDIDDKRFKLLKDKIDFIMKYTHNWNYKDDLFYKERSTYASKLYKKTKCKFYKFSKSKYKTYFVMGSNCCYFVDDVMGEIGIPRLTFTGINTPGTFYDYLNKELMKKKSRVIYKKIYDVNNKI